MKIDALCLKGKSRFRLNLELIQGDLTIRQKIAEVGESEIAISIVTQLVFST